MLILLVPSMIVLYFLGYEMTSVLLQAGEFNLDASLLTGRTLHGYTVGLFSLGIFNFLQRFFYSANNQKIPFIAAIIVGVLDIVLSIVLKNTPLRVMGLALANSISFFAGMIFLLVVARRTAGGLNIRKIAFTLVKILVACIILSAFFIFSDRLFKDYWLSGRNLKNMGILVLKGIFAIGLVFFSYRLMKVEMFRKRRKQEKV